MKQVIKKKEVKKNNIDVRKFHTTRCEVCSGIDGIVEDVTGYCSERDRREWSKEGRVVKEFVKQPDQNIPFCVCPIEAEHLIVEEDSH